MKSGRYRAANRISPFKSNKIINDFGMFPHQNVGRGDIHLFVDFFSWFEYYFLIE